VRFGKGTTSEPALSEVEGDLLSGFPDIFDYYFDPTAWSAFVTI